MDGVEALLIGIGAFVGAISTLIVAFAFQLNSGQKVENIITQQYLERAEKLEEKVERLEDQSDLLGQIVNTLDKTSVTLEAMLLLLDDTSQRIRNIEETMTQYSQKN